MDYSRRFSGIYAVVDEKGEAVQSEITVSMQQKAIQILNDHEVSNNRPAVYSAKTLTEDELLSLQKRR